MAVLHVCRDSLWSYGGRKAPNDGFRADEIVAAEALKREEEEEEEGEVRSSFVWSIAL